MSEIEKMLNEVQAQTPLKIWIPTLGEFRPFKHLTFHHYSQFLTLERKQHNTDAENIVARIEFLGLLNKVIEECYLSSATPPNFTIIDRNAIALQLRLAIDDKFKVVYGEKTKDVSLKDHVNFVTSIGISQFERNIVIPYEKMSVTMDIPSIVTDQLINREIVEYDHTSDTFSTFVLFAETVKYIKSVSFRPDLEVLEEELFKPGHIAESIQVCRMLPYPLVEKIAAYILKVQDVNSRIMSVKCDIEGKDELVQVNINPIWFTNS